MLTGEEEGELYELIRSGRAKELRLHSGLTLMKAAERAAVDFRSLGNWERTSYPSRAEERERYFRLLCEWRIEYGSES